MSQDELEYEDEEFEDQEYEQDDDFEDGYEDDDQDFEEEEEEYYGDEDQEGNGGDGQDAYFPPSDEDRPRNRGRYRDEIYSRRVPAGKRTYFFDVKTTRSGKDYFLTITESKKVGENRYEKHKLFLYKEDFGKFVSAMHEVVRFIQDECLPDYEFRGLPDVSKQEGELDDDWSDEEGSY